MLNTVAMVAVFLMWCSLIWLPLMVLRAVELRGKPQMWQITAIMAFVLVLMGFTRAMSSTNPMEVLAWSLAWIVPIAVTLFVRNAVSVPFSQWDKWAGAVALVSFLPAAGFLPSALQAVAGALW